MIAGHFQNLPAERYGSPRRPLHGTQARVIQLLRSLFTCYNISLLNPKPNNPNSGLRLLRTLMKTSDLVEIKETFSAEMETFAQQLIRQRRLPEALQIQTIRIDHIAQDLRSGTRAINELNGISSFLIWAHVWIKEFGRRSDAEVVSLKLMHARQPMCPRFHIDNVPLRLLATLSGPTTEWLKSGNVRQLQDGTICQEIRSTDIQHMSPGSVGFFKGSYGQRKANSGVVHRSPQSNADRILLKIDIAPGPLNPRTKAKYA